MSWLNLDYIEAPLINGKRLFRGNEEVGFVRNEEFQPYAEKKTDDPPTIFLHPSQYTIEEVTA